MSNPRSLIHIAVIGMLVLCAGSPSFAQRRATEFEPSYVVLHRAREDDGRLRIGDNDPLMRELGRQYILMIAREEMGHHTRDELLCDQIDIPADAERVDLRATILAPGGHDAQTASLERIDGERTKKLLTQTWQTRGNPSQTYVKHAHYLNQSQSRNMRRALGAAGLRTRARPWAGDAAVPDEVASLLLQPTLSCQFHAVRELHALMDQGQASPQIVAALVRGYANLSALTERAWSTRWAAFAARALLYGDRLVEHDRSPASRDAYAYALAVVGLHPEALSRLDAAARERSDLAQLAYWMTTYDYDALLKVAEDTDNPNHELAALLAGLAVDQDAVDVAAAVIPQLVALAPACQRLTETTNIGHELGIARQSTQHGFAAIEQDMIGCPHRPADLPAQAKQLLDDPAAGGRSMVAPGLCDALVAHGRQAAGELPLSVLGTLGRDAIFSQSIARLEFERFMWAIDPSNSVQAFEQINADHPYLQLITAYGQSDDDARKSLNEMQLQDLPFRLRRLERLMETLGGPRVRIDRRTWGAVIGNTFSIVPATSRSVLQKFKASRVTQPMLNEAYDAAPDAPMTIANRVYLVPPRTAAQQQAVIKAGGEFFAVQMALARHFAMAGDDRQAAEWFGKAAEKYQILDPIISHAALIGKNGDLEAFINALSPALDLPSRGLEHARILEVLADAHAAMGDDKTALKYYEQAAQSFSARSLIAYAWGLERVGQWDKASQMYAAVSNRYGGENNAIDWHRWCLSRGQGDREAAARTVVREGGEPGRAMAIMRIAVLKDDVEPQIRDDLLTQLRRAAAAGDILSQFVMATYHMQPGREQGREQAFARIESNLKGPAPRPGTMEGDKRQLARILKPALDAVRAGRPPTAKMFEPRMNDPYDKSWTATHVAMALDAAGEHEAALPYYRTALAGETMHQSLRDFAVYRIRQIDPDTPLENVLREAYRPAAREQVESYINNQINVVKNQ